MAQQTQAQQQRFKEWSTTNWNPTFGCSKVDTACKNC